MSINNQTIYLLCNKGSKERNKNVKLIIIKQSLNCSTVWLMSLVFVCVIGKEWHFTFTCWWVKAWVNWKNILQSIISKLNHKRKEGTNKQNEILKRPIPWGYRVLLLVRQIQNRWHHVAGLSIVTARLIRWRSQRQWNGVQVVVGAAGELLLVIVMLLVIRALYLSESCFQRENRLWKIWSRWTR
jgi:hypothetical protein